MFNFYFFFILSAFIISSILTLVSSYLNLKHLSPEIPEEFRNDVSPEKYADSQKYTRDRTSFGIIALLVNSLLFLGFWFIGGFNYADLIARKISSHYILHGLAFFAILGAAQWIISLPFSLYSTFVIENRWGFNRTTVGTFISDRIKGIILSTIVGGPLVAFIIWFFSAMGSIAWLVAFAAAAGFSIILQFLAPVVIMPLFNKFTPLEDGELKEAITQMCHKAGFPFAGVYIVDGSKRSTKANAFFTGFGKTRRIALYDTLVNEHKTEEIIAVLAHEIGHWKHGHIRKSMILGLAEMAFMFWLMGMFISREGLFHAFAIENISVHAGMLLFATLFSPLSSLTGIAHLALSRRNEFEADAFSKEITGNWEALASGLQRLSLSSLSNLTPHPLHVFLNYSHPPVTDRIRKLRTLPETAS
ncbi:M48 family metallopeptidase [Myxococcota bacterium]|nr:M48 family metallopeptidase [Myxococcota bacterium]MBU1380920.1 M48 family metallopeptidase [Myxococcota bacterium]MBU1496556.1 M48 family metallopeptidase [Myxococcota bacterium]